MTTIQPPVCPTFIHLDETSPTPIACCCNEDRGCLVLVFNLCALLAPSSHPDLPLPVSTLSSANTCSHSPFRRRWLAQVPSIAQPLTSVAAILALASDPAPCLLIARPTSSRGPYQSKKRNCRMAMGPMKPPHDLCREEDPQVSSYRPL